MHIIKLPELEAHLTPDLVIEAVRAALIEHAQGGVVSPPPGQLVFDHPPGDCHIKFGRFRRGDTFVIKVATGFYENPRSGLPVNNGLILVFDARTGAPKALLEDQGFLTSWRTAAAGVLAARAGAPSRASVLGVMGTGHQARLQARWVARALGISAVRIHGRSLIRAERLANELRESGLQAAVSQSIEALLEECRLVITCTASTAAILPSDAVHPGTHIVALGADTPGKQELDPRIFARATVIMTDDLSQCVDHGDLSHAINQGLVSADAAVALGDVLSGRCPGRRAPHDITVADLTGIAATDIAIATLALGRIDSVPSPASPS